MFLIIKIYILNITVETVYYNVQSTLYMDVITDHMGFI